MRRARALAAGVVLAAVSYVGLDIANIAPGILTTDRPVAAPIGAPSPADPGGSGRAGSDPQKGTPQSSGPAQRLTTADPAALPLAPAGTDAPAPDPAALGARLAPLVGDASLGPDVGVAVRDGRTGAVLYESGASTAHTPASLTKLITAAAIATSVPVEERLTTRVVRGVTPDDIVLVAGGDTLLAPAAGSPGAVSGRAGLGDLAAQVARRLTAQGVASARLWIDEAGLAGPRIDPAWEPADVAIGYAGPVAPLGLATQRPQPGHAVPDDPALSVAEAFRAALVARGIAVPTPVARGAAPAGAEQLGAVSSATLADQLGVALADSDNTLTAALARVAAVRAGRSPTFPAVAAWVGERVAAMGVPVEGLVVADASGLAPGSKASAATVVALLAHATTGSSKPLARVYAELPAAGLVGTLAERFLMGPQRAGAGLVRAKTGTLTGVSSLAGTVVDADGRLLVFAALADRVPGAGTDDARAALDRLAAALAGCGCR